MTTEPAPDEPSPPDEPASEPSPSSEETTPGIVRIAVRIALPLLVLAIAGGIAAALVLSRDEPASGAESAPALVVETEAAAREQLPFVVEAQGEVTAARSTDLRPQVSGRVTWVSPHLEPGAIVHEGDPLFRIDRTDFRLALERSRAQLAEAQLRRENEEARRAVARAEWDTYEDEFGPEEPPALALRKPQAKAAAVGLRSAAAQVAQNRVALARTTVTAPFDAFVDAESLQVGDLVNPQTRAASLVGVGHFWVRAAVPVAELPRIAVADDRGALGDEARVHLREGDLDLRRTGHVVRILGRLDAASRMAQVLIRIDDPFELERPAEERGLPLFVGSYVDVTIHTERVHDVVRVPSASLRDGSEVFVYEDGALRIEPVSGIRWRGEDVLVGEGLEGEERLVVTPLSQPVEGMALRRADEDSS